MIELDHSTLNAAPPPEPAKSMTADLLLNLELQQRRRFAGRNQERQRVSTGCEILDELLDGGDATGGRGMERGIVVGVSAEGREGEGILLSLNLLASILLPHLSTPKKPTTPLAQIIDTTGSFPLALLAQVVKSRISSHQTICQNPTKPTPNDQEITNLAQKALELISISRVFDISGLWEVLREINHPPTPPTPTPPAAGQSSADWPSTSDSADQTVDQADQNVSIPTSFILGKEGPQKEGEEEGIQILIIHTLTPLINDLLARREKSEAHTLLTTLSTTLHTLSKESNILTLLHNTTLPTSSLHPRQNNNQNQNQSKKSLFPSSTQKPALGQIFTQFPSLHILISKLPKRKRDAELAYAEDSATHQTSLHGHTNHGKATEEETEFCYVLEILKDETPSFPPYKRKFGALEQKWLPLSLSLSPQKTSFARVFEGSLPGTKVSNPEIDTHPENAEGGEGDGARGKTTESRVGLGVGNIAKIYGFGGRRV